MAAPTNHKGETMKALSLWQPHAQAIALGLKPFETRDWATSYRGPLAIHAAKRRWDDSGTWHDQARRIMTRHNVLWGTTQMPLGVVVCVVDLVDCVRTSDLRGRIPEHEEFWGDFSDGEAGRGRYAFRLRNVRVLAQPVSVRGQQGFFEVDLPGFSGATAPARTLSLFGGEL
jgi:activating signal cointegrator 1